MMRYTRNLAMSIIPAISSLLLLIPISVFGQFAFSSADATPLDSSELKWEISSITSTVLQKDVTSITLLDGINGEKIRVDDVVYFPGSIAGKINGFQIPSVPLRRGGNYVLVVSVIVRKANGQFDRLETRSAAINIPNAAPSAPQPQPPPTVTILKPIKSKEKKDSDVYLAGEFVAVRGSKPVYAIEVKVEPRFGSGKWDYSPFFNLNASTDPEADPDSMNFGFKAARSIPFTYDANNKWTPRLTSLYLSMAGKFESERDFDNVNATFDPLLDFVINTIPLGKKATFTFIPFIGAEVGKNLKSPLPAAEGDRIARVLAGGHLLLDVPFETHIEGITFTADYTRRWLLSNELRFKTNDDDTLALVEFGKSPRDFFESKLEFGVNKFFGPYIAYDWGMVPPSYKLVDHRVRIGFVYKFKFSN